jgi:hypothetical protein
LGSGFSFSPFSPPFMLVLDTTRIYTDDDTSVLHTCRLAIPYSLICGPIEDSSYLFENHVATSFYDEFGNLYHVLEPFGKVFDNWLKALEQEQYKSITFSQQ